MSRTVVVAGAGLAGLRAAEQLRAAGWDERIVIVGDEPHPPYNRPPLSKEALRDGVDHARLAFRQRPSVSDVEWRLGHRVTGVDLARRSLSIDDAEAMQYDGLVIATGVGSRRLNLDAPLAWRHTIRRLEDAQALRPQLNPGTRVAIIGGGFIGCEVAATAVARGCKVTVVEPSGAPLSGAVGDLVGGEVRRRHEQQGVTFLANHTVTALEGHGSPAVVVLDDGSRVATEVVVEAVGSVANTSWLEGQGLDLTNGVLCDVNLHPLIPDGPVLDTVSLGDVARFPNPRFPGASHRIEHWTMPTDTAGHAARSLLSSLHGHQVAGRPFAPLPTFWSDQYDTRIQSFGMPSLGLDDVRVIEGDLREECAVGYHRDDHLVGVVLIGLTKQMGQFHKLVQAATEHSQLAEVSS